MKSFLCCFFDAIYMEGFSKHYHGVPGISIYFTATDPMFYFPSTYITKHIETLKAGGCITTTHVPLKGTPQRAFFVSLDGLHACLRPFLYVTK